jgi:hypothetical protein
MREAAIRERGVEPFVAEGGACSEPVARFLSPLFRGSLAPAGGIDRIREDLFFSSILLAC